MIKYTMEICDAETNEYTTIAWFTDFTPIDVLLDLSETMYENVEGASSIIVVDKDTGAIVTSVTIDDEENFDWDYNEDMGFDPYMGCYTEDC